MRLKRAVALTGVAAAALVAQRAPTVATPPPNRYVDSVVCATCHADKAATFSKTGMGRSFYKLTAANAVEAFGKTFYHQASESYFVMFERGGRYYQRRWQKGADGSEINVDEKSADYVMGSGNHGRTYLHMSANQTLQELPLGWYAEKGGYWSMAPGYDRVDYPGSTRVATYECMSCHNAYPQIPKGHDEPGAKPQFVGQLPEGIDCQRCHGPGGRHVEVASKPGATATAIRAAIVNPKRLSADRELEVCMQCHLETTAVALPHDIQKFDRAPFSYIPGQPLGDFRLTFDRANGMGERFEVAHAAYRMRESQCYLKSGDKDGNGKLRCTTCHDPHNIPRGDAATKHYNDVCLTCHGTTFTKTVAAGAHTKETNCVQCHMPKRRTEDAVYMLMTEHFIRAKQPTGDLTAARAEQHETTATSYKGEVVPYYPKTLAPTKEESELYLALAQVVESSNLRAGLPQLESLVQQYHPKQTEFYTGLAEGLASVGQAARALPYFEEAARLAPGSSVVLRKLGSAQMEGGQLPQAEATLRRVLALTPNDAGTWAMLGQVLASERRNADAEAAFAKGIECDPEIPEIHNSMATMLLNRGDAAGAEKEFREAMRIQPSSPQIQANVAAMLAQRGAAAEAKFHFERALQLKPEFAEARLNYARLLGSLGEMDEAEKQIRAAMAADPRVSGAARQLLQQLGR